MFRRKIDIALPHRKRKGGESTDQLTGSLGGSKEGLADDGAGATGRTHRQCPLMTASWLSKITFWSGICVLLKIVIHTLINFIEYFILFITLTCHLLMCIFDNMSCHPGG